MVESIFGGAQRNAQRKRTAVDGGRRELR